MTPSSGPVPRDAGAAASRPALASILRGAALAVRGTGHAISRGSVLTTCWPLYLVTVAVTLIVQGLLVWQALRLTESGADAGAWAAVGLALLRVLAVLAALGGGAVLGLLIAALAVPLFAERIFLTSLRALAAERAVALERAPGLPIKVEVAHGLRRIGRFIPRFLGAVTLTLVPLIGPLLGPAAQVYVASRFLGWELLEPLLASEGMSYADQIARLARHRWLLVGFALPFIPVLAVPLAGPFFFTVAQAAIALLVHEEL